MNQDLQNAIDEARIAAELAVKRQRAKNVGRKIGEAIGSSIYSLRRTDEQIDSMSTVEIDSWLDGVELNPPDASEVPPV